MAHKRVETKEKQIPKEKCEKNFNKNVIKSDKKLQRSAELPSEPLTILHVQISCLLHRAATKPYIFLFVLCDFINALHDDRAE